MTERLEGDLPPLKPECAEALDRVYEFLDHEMSEADCDRIREHLADCGPCLEQYDLDEALKALVRRSCACEPAPDQLRAKVLTRITAVRVQVEVREQ
ncbi:mycothiol system anti-sigma-R factor [Angustibacter aerolatus]